MTVTIRQTERLEGTLRAQGSKNYTSRYVLAAALAHGESVLRNPASIDDTQVMIDCCRQLGAEITPTSDGLEVRGTGGRLRAPGRLDVGNAGAVCRFLMAVAATLPQPTQFVTPFPASLGRRPHSDLLNALESLGCHCESQDGRLPITIGGGLRKAGPVTVSGSTSSQYTTGLLFLAPLLEGLTEITVVGEQRSAILLRQTLQVLGECGVTIDHSVDWRRFVVRGPQPYQAGSRHIPGDWPGASAILAAAAVTNGQVTVTGLYDDGQGEQAIVPVLAAMGANIRFDRNKRSVTVCGGRPLHGIEFDGDRATDAVMSMVAVACFAQGVSHFYNIENIRYKESDRITDYCHELRKLGARLDETRDSIIVYGSPEGLSGGASIDAHHDHRLLMGASIVALRCAQPVQLNEAEHVSKSYPHFFTDMAALGARIQTTR